MKNFVFLVVLCSTLLAACGPSAEQITATAVMAQAQTETAAPTLTFTPTATPTITLTPTVTATLTPTPTRTPPPTATPSSLGATVDFDQVGLKVSAMWATTHTHIVPGGRYYYYAEKGNTFVEMGVFVSNPSDKPVKYKVSDIFLIDEDKRPRRPGFGAWKTVNAGIKVDPAGLKLPSDPLEGDEEISFERDTYLRLIFYVKDKQTFIFRIFNSPPFTFDINK